MYHHPGAPDQEPAHPFIAEIGRGIKWIGFGGIIGFGSVTMGNLVLASCDITAPADSEVASKVEENERIENYIDDVKWASGGLGVSAVITLCGISIEAFGRGQEED